MLDYLSSLTRDVCHCAVADLGLRVSCILRASCGTQRARHPTHDHGHPMTKTRRKAREDAAHDDEEGPSHAGATTSLPVPVPEDIDLDYLSEILPNIPDFSRVNSDVVAVLYKLVVGLNTDLDGLRREVDELQGEVERKDVELDQALQDKESLSKDLEGNVESVHSELEQLKQEREKLGSCHSYAAPLKVSSSCLRVFVTAFSGRERWSQVKSVTIVQLASFVEFRRGIIQAPS